MYKHDIYTFCLQFVLEWTYMYDLLVLYVSPYAWGSDMPFVPIYIKHRFCIKMHVTKYGYNEFGPMVPWDSL